MTDSLYWLCLRVRLKWNHNVAVRWLVYILVVSFLARFIDQLLELNRLMATGVFC